MVFHSIYVAYLIHDVGFFALLQDSVLRNCRPTMRPFKASRMNLLFLFLLSLMLVLACVVIGYVIMNEERYKFEL